MMKTKVKHNIFKRMAAMMLAFAVAFTMIPFAAGDLDAHAASYWKGLKAKATSRTSASISWTQLTKKQRKKISGITVYRNGKAVKNIRKTAKSFSESGLKAGTTYSYQLKTYKASKQKQWFNKKTGKWQKKKPKKKWRGKSRKITVYKYANTSTAMKITTPKPAAPATSSSGTTSGTTGGSTSGGTTGGNTGGGTVTPDPDPPAPTITEDTTTYVDFGGVQIHIGQTWNSTLDGQLSSNANGTWSCVRLQGYLTDSGDYKAITTITYNINTYEAFMALYVVDGQVGGWATNSDPFFVCQGVSLARGQSKDTYPQMCKKFSAGNLGCLVMGVGLNGTYRGGSDADERTIGYHYINAARVAAGRAPLKRNKYLEGVDLSSGANLTWSGTIPEGFYGEGSSLTNQRYGAQTWAETMAASGKIGHSALSNGPFGYENCPIEGITAKQWSNAGAGVRGSIPWFASDERIGIDGENVGMGIGDDCIYVYNDSPLHLGPMLSDSMKSIGIGYSGGYHCEQYSENEE